ncbi:hypothetical protein SLS55_007207 [Diplodia seriata]|uniref:PNPLA domain-containing protein n=1 Tax=Diplodia seriata TaxID=420778 RepID=A0ABR3CE49_9PEZI
MDNLIHLSEDGVKDLPSLPSQTSFISPTQYVIKHTSEDYVAASGPQIQAKIWFKSPALQAKTIRMIRGLRLFADSHDQGWCSDRKAGNWTWLELAILPDESATSPKTAASGLELVWTSHVNSLATKDYTWLSGEVFDERRDFFSLLEPGNVIAVRLCARFAGWEIYAKNGYLAVDIGDESFERKSVHYGPIVSKLNKIDETLREVNQVTNSAFLPSLPNGIDTAQLIEKGANERSLRVLSLDGGGVRGLSSLLQLKAVMDKISPNKKPCELFDMIGGTSTGGLIAIMLGRLRMSVDECLDAYRKFMSDVFDHGLLVKAKNYTVEKGLYSAKTLEKIIRDLIRERLGTDDAILNDENDSVLGEVHFHRCRVFVMAVRKDAANNRKPVFLRSYNNPNDVPLLPSIKIWEAARATSAAPYYFAPLDMGNVKLVDGGLGANNPLGWLWTEILGVFGASRKTACFLSIGTGIASNTPVPDPGVVPTFKSIEDFASIATNSEITHNLFSGLIDAFAPKPLARKYWRLNIGVQIPEWEEEKGMLWWKHKELHPDNFQDVGNLDDLSKQKMLEELTKEYVKSNDTPIGECAKALVDAT